MKRRIYRLNRRKSLIYLILFTINATIYKYALPLKVDLRELTEVKTCPACYGHDLCSQIDSGLIQLVGASQWTISELFNEKSVYLASWPANNASSRRLMLKRLATRAELAAFDARVCEWSRPDADSVGCSLQDGIARLAKSLTKNGSGRELTVSASQLQASRAFQNTELIKCSDQTVINSLTKTALGHRAGSGDSSPPSLENVLSMLMVNQEPLVSMIFPGGRGWPFPAYLGACGRVAAFQFIGETLNTYYNSGWLLRAYFALQLLEMAAKFTQNRYGLGIYPTDWDPTNFAVQASTRKVFLIDMENIIVVNQTRVKQLKAPGWNVYHTAERFGCFNCFSYAAEDLCTHAKADHNFHGVCGALLSTDPYSTGLKHGLLHSVPSGILSRHPLLTTLIQDCKKSAKTGGREAAAELIMEILRSELEDVDLASL